MTHGLTRRERATRLSIVVTGDEPPTEFRIFTSGVVESTKGDVTFDADAAKSVMAEYAEHAIDLMIDYDHASLAYASLDPAQAGKAAGWFNLEVRGGELWAVNVRWTPPAADALRRKEWRFMSPAFNTDKEGRVTSLLNVAITNLPATRRLEPLMAASIKALSGAGMLSPETIKEALDALIAGDEAKCMELLKGIVTEAASGEPADAEEPAADPEAVLAAEPGDKPEEVVAALSAVTSLSGKSLVSSVAEIRQWHASHVELATERKKLADREAVLESAERRKLCVELVTQAGRAPAAVWSDAKSTGPKKYLSAMPIADFREYVSDAIKSHGGKSAAPKVPTTTTLSVEGLRHDELANCKAIGADPAVYAQLKAARSGKA
ncbi:MAG TPA: phage protease [Gemmatimonadaceae bacterium]|nr:phage protease [Gemmatimonadaceae bacterium]